MKTGSNKYGRSALTLYHGANLTFHRVFQEDSKKDVPKLGYKRWGEALTLNFMSFSFQNCYCNTRTEELVIPKSDT